jgi:DNA-directed RNA polymerase specialized sigma24 family protein
MNHEEKEITVLIEGVNRMEIGALLELKHMFQNYAIGKYWERIGRFHGNKYLDDYISKVEEEVLKSIKSFIGIGRAAFCGYINGCIINAGKNFCRDYIKSEYKFLSLKEKFGVISVSSHFLKNGNAEDFVVSKITKYEILFEHILPELTNAQRGAVLRKMDDIETVKEYAKKVACTENTIRAHESKAIKKMKEKAADKKLKELYHL